MAINDAELFDDNIDAWPWGPIIRSIYGEFQSLEKKPIIGKKATTIIPTGEGPLDFKLSVPNEPEPDKVLQAIQTETLQSNRACSAFTLDSDSH